jgi:hypothetical protein
MQMRKLAGIILILIAAAFSTVQAAEKSAPDPSEIRRHLLDSVGTLPWNLDSGYSLNGQFTLQAGGEDIPYEARFARSLKRWAADFTQEDQSRNLRYVVSGDQAWIASPEITEEVSPDMFPYVAQFDFPGLYNELLLMLQKGKHIPSFKTVADKNDIYISGKLRNGWEAIFILNTVEYFPRKVLMTVGDKPSSAWLLPFVGPDRSCSLTRVPNPSTKFEIWFSEPVQAEGYQYAKRMDFWENGSVVGTFIQEGSSRLSESYDLFLRPPKFPWLESIRFTPRADLRRASLYLDQSEIPALRSRIEQNPWARWSRENRIIAYWAALMSWTGRIFPRSVSFRLISLAVAIGFVGFIILLIRRCRQFRQAFPLKLLLLGMLASGFIMTMGIASRQFHKAGNRSLFALHAAIRYTITGQPFFAGRADALLTDFVRNAPAFSIEELGSSCQAYALAYDLIRADLPLKRRQQIENDLFLFATPLFGASQGWISNRTVAGALSSGLGMVGLAIGHEPFVAAARETAEKILRTRLTGGLHRSGPGPGSQAMDFASNFFYSLKHTRRVNYYADPAFRQYVNATLQMLSPVGTLPLFGDTYLDQSARLSVFLLKIANQLPEEEGRWCVFANNRHRMHSRYRVEGWSRWILPAFQPLMMFYENPYVLLQYTRRIVPFPPPSSSAVLGDKQAAVLRSGIESDSFYLALNTPRFDSEDSHRDILTFDLYAYGGLLLHGPGFPGKNHPGYEETVATAAGNTLTMNDESQSAHTCTGIVSSLLNQPLFDHVRALADKTYDFGQVQRDIVLVRPEKNSPSYFFLLDDVFVSNPGTSVQWHLHGRGKLVTGIDQASRWTSTAFSSEKSKRDRIVLEAVHPMGGPGNLTTKSGTLYSPNSSLNQVSAGTTIEWFGSRRFSTILIPHKSGEPAPKIEIEENPTCRVGAADWISLGSPKNPVTTGPLSHVSEYVIVRDRAKGFPALLMVSGNQCRFGAHSLSCTKPLTASLDGLRGGFLTPRPNTRVEIRSPEIHKGDRFRLDDGHITAEQSGILSFTLAAIGPHSFAREIGQN